MNDNQLSLNAHCSIEFDRWRGRTHSSPTSVQKGGRGGLLLASMVHAFDFNVLEMSCFPCYWEVP